MASTRPMLLRLLNVRHAVGVGGDQVVQVHGQAAEMVLQ
jgi:hypothetical protein